MNDRLETLLGRYLDGTASESEQNEFAGYLYDPAQQDRLGQAIGQAFSSHQPEGNPLPQAKQQAILEQIYRKTGQAATARKLWTRIAVAASILLVAGISLIFYLNQSKQNDADSIYASDIAPGKNGATLTLASGKQITLSQAATGQLASEAGVAISKTADGELVYTVKQAQDEHQSSNTLSTSNGQTYQVQLPDGSRVWLNAASSLTYPARFGAKQRRVELSGEAYFEIAKDKAHPFIVKTDKQEVEVLGTHFNISSYASDPHTTTTLLEGSVKVRSALASGPAGQPEEKTLRPGQQASLTTGSIAISQVEAENAIAWKNGLFIFEQEPLESIMKKIARWYDVEISYRDIDPDQQFGGSVSRYDKISKILEKLEQTGGIHFKIEGRRVTVMK